MCSTTACYLHFTFDVRNIVKNFTRDGVLVIKAKEALLDSSLVAKLPEIKINLIEISEKKNCSMLSAYNDVITANFGTDSCGIRLYLDKRLRKNTDLVTIASMSRLDISPSTYNLLLPRWKEVFLCSKKCWL